MSLEDFKDWFFDVLDDGDNGIMADIDANEKANSFRLRMIDGSVFEIICRKL